MVLLNFWTTLYDWCLHLYFTRSISCNALNTRSWPQSGWGSVNSLLHLVSHFCQQLTCQVNMLTCLTWLICSKTCHSLKMFQDLAQKWLQRRMIFWRGVEKFGQFGADLHPLWRRRRWRHLIKLESGCKAEFWYSIIAAAQRRGGGDKSQGRVYEMSSGGCYADVMLLGEPGPDVTRWGSKM